MTNEEFSNEFDVLYNSITSNQAPGLDEYEKSVFLTKAQDEIVKSYFNPKLNKSQEGFDANEKRQIDFSMIMRSISYESNRKEIFILEEVLSKFNNLGYGSAIPDSIQNSIPNPTEDELPESIISYEQLDPFIGVGVFWGQTLFMIRRAVYDVINKNILNVTESSRDITAPSESGFKINSYTVRYFDAGIFDNRFNTKSITVEDDIMMFINEYVEVKRNNSISRLTVLPINYIEYSRLMSKPYKRPLKNQAWRIIDNSNSHKKVEIVIGPNDTLNKYVIRYVKRPQAIILCDLEDVTLDNKNKKQPCELDEALHPEILQRAVELAKAAYTGNLGDQITLGQASQTNMGAIQSSR